MENLSQSERVAQYLGEGGKLTTLNAWQELGISRLAARVYDLKCMGYKVKSTQVPVYNRFGEKCMVAEYELESDNG